MQRTQNLIYVDFCYSKDCSRSTKAFLGWNQQNLWSFLTSDSKCAVFISLWPMKSVLVYIILQIYCPNKCLEAAKRRNLLLDELWSTYSSEKRNNTKKKWMKSQVQANLSLHETIRAFWHFLSTTWGIHTEAKHFTKKNDEAERGLQVKVKDCRKSRSGAVSGASLATYRHTVWWQYRNEGFISQAFGGFSLAAPLAMIGFQKHSYC